MRNINRGMNIVYTTKFQLEYIMVSNNNYFFKESLQPLYCNDKKKYFNVVTAHSKQTGHCIYALIQCENCNCGRAIVINDYKLDKIKKQYEQSQQNNQ